MLSICFYVGHARAEVSASNPPPHAIEGRRRDVRGLERKMGALWGRGGGGIVLSNYFDVDGSDDIIIIFLSKIRCWWVNFHCGKHRTHGFGNVVAGASDAPMPLGCQNREHGLAMQ